ncbi:MAG TPA: glycosyltransferase family 2 protein [Bacteroidales bacterium]|nr:glycosyltransferase family 2 protein [Bacteroidales bacterium]
MHKTAIVILNWNGLEYLKKFLGNVILHSTDPDTVIYVADNGSTDGSVEWVSSNFSGLKIIQLGKNHGFADGYNLALEQIDATYYLLLNSDIEVTEEWLNPLVNFMDANPDVASCQPKIRSYSERDFFEHAGAAGCFIDKYGFPFCRGRIFHHVEKDTGQYDNQAEIFWSSGACMIVRSDAWKKAGGFDPSFFAHMEEIDLCWRFSRLGYRVCYIPDSVIYHVGGGSLPYTSPFKTYLNFRNSLYLLYKNLPDKKFQKTLFIRKLLDGAAGLMFLSKGDFVNFKSVWNAHIDYYRNKKELKMKRNSLKNIGSSDTNAGILNKSIVFEFYVRGRRTFGLINMDQKK